MKPDPTGVLKVLTIGGGPTVCAVCKAVNRVSVCIKLQSCVQPHTLHCDAHVLHCIALLCTQYSNTECTTIDPERWGPGREHPNKQGPGLSHVGSGRHIAVLGPAFHRSSEIKVFLKHCSRPKSNTGSKDAAPECQLQPERCVMLPHNKACLILVGKQLTRLEKAPREGAKGRVSILRAIAISCLQDFLCDVVVQQLLPFSLHRVSICHMLWDQKKQRGPSCHQHGWRF